MEESSAGAKERKRTPALDYRLVNRASYLPFLFGLIAKPDRSSVTTGYIVGATGSFVGAFLTAGIVLVIGIVAYVFILGRLEPIADPPAA